MQKMQKKKYCLLLQGSNLRPSEEGEKVKREKVLPAILLNIAHRIISYIFAGQIFDMRKN